MNNKKIVMPKGQDLIRISKALDKAYGNGYVSQTTLYDNDNYDYYIRREYKQNHATKPVAICATIGYDRDGIECVVEFNNTIYQL